MHYYIKSSLLVFSGLHDVYFNEAQQESPKPLHLRYKMRNTSQEWKS